MRNVPGKFFERKRSDAEIFSFAWTDFDITTHPFYKEADIINLHWIAGFLDYKSFFAKNTKPVVWTLHDQNAFTGCCHYSMSCDKFIKICDYCPLLNNSNVYKSHIVKIRALAKFNNLTIVSPSNWLKSISQKSSLFNRFPHHHIPYGLDMSVYKSFNKVFAREVFGIPEDKKVLLFVCDDLNNSRKGFALLLEALNKINNKDVLFYAVGYSGKDIPNVNILGRINNDRLMALLYCAADAFVLPSLEDNLPNTMLESVSCGTPVIAFPNGGITEVIIHGNNGILAQNNTSKALAEAIQVFLNGDVLFDRDSIRASAIQLFAPEIQGKKYIELYKSILQSE
ncbi:MAG: glycosyltransferase [Chloroflexia bacterium]|nr:glycosyltransferase [Chloroflexia bacterium]